MRGDQSLEQGDSGVILVRDRKHDLEQRVVLVKQRFQIGGDGRAGALDRNHDRYRGQRVGGAKRPSRPQPHHDSGQIAESATPHQKPKTQPNNIPRATPLLIYADTSKPKRRL